MSVGHGQFINTAQSQRVTSRVRRPSLTSLCACLWMLMSVSAAALPSMTVDDAKARYLIEIAKHVDWPDQSGLGELQVAIVSSRASTRRAFERLGEVSVDGRPLRLQYFASDELDPAAFDLIFLGDRFRSLYSDWFESTSSTLIVVDGNVPREAMMVSMVEVGGQVSLRLNRENLIAHGFSASVALLEFAGTREDLSEELRLKQSRLRLVLDEVAAKERRLGELDRQLAENSTNLESAQAALARGQEELERSRKQLQLLTQEITLASVEVTGYRDQISEQQALFEGKQAELQAKQEQIREREQLILRLESDIESSQAVLDSQLSEIDRQRTMLENKNQTIDAQRESMWLITVIMLIVLVVAFFLLRLNALRTRANLELEKLNSQLYEMATTDSLSGLYNRRQFLRSAEDAFAAYRSVDAPMAMLMMDIDNFKQINDRYGHATGDAVIKAVSDVLSHRLRESDILGRLGGEEFAMMLVRCDQVEALNVGHRLCKDVAGLEIGHSKGAVGVTISIGLATVEAPDQGIEAAMLRADKALYQAKSRGRNQVLSYEPDLGAPLTG
ncbi:MAG: DUF4154 domain-containing protein [Xanthomonadales bacterium]|nr:DUF4154 domain-containing protein [Xanthomonadales bacterium]